MANPAHEALLRQGVDQWNDWRFQNGSVTPDLTGIRMPAARLEGIDLSHAKLGGATLIRAKLNGADLRHADLRDAKLHETDFTDADLFRANLEDAVLASAKLRRARFYGANLRGCQLTVADFRKADFRAAELACADLRESQGSGSSFEKADLTGALLKMCDLSGCNLSEVRGLSSRQIEVAFTDDGTLLPEALGPSSGEPLEALCRVLESLKARATGQTVPGTDISSYHSVLDQLASRGIDTQEARIENADRVRPAKTAAAGEWVDAALFRGRLDHLLSVLRKPGAP